MSFFRFSIVTPDGEYYSGDIESLSVNTPDGRIGIMHGALPRVAVLSAGEINIKAAATEHRFESGDGILYVEREKVTALTESCSAFGEKKETAAPSDEPELDYRIAKAKIARSVRKMKKRS